MTIDDDNMILKLFQTTNIYIFNISLEMVIGDDNMTLKLY